MWGALSLRTFCWFARDTSTWSLVQLEGEYYKLIVWYFSAEGDRIIGLVVSVSLLIMRSRVRFPRFHDFKSELGLERGPPNLVKIAG